ncbi:sirohydrochlorin ferrochelatase [Arthrobacter pigmenti]|uniref:Sirohydrochlorin ferrochelatase n=1 Tax=Arthrobacter pigmenti TaxID=271432 RepID=A0A846RJA2_9MICC|nr:CbiX/SirB N-terminal domain-containing protein [Arthrobacter pigmenti]NJC23313.1 sirohydrochlorin ferrochelatase [Arthrobacter pigmenti]
MQTHEHPVLVACSHGTSSTEGQAAVNRMRDEMRLLRPGLDIREAYVDVQQPDLPDVVAALPDGPAVIVPLLLSVGYHVKVDIAEAVAGRPGTVASAPLGPDPRLAKLLQQRLEEAGVEAGAAVVLAAAGSSDPSAAEDVSKLLEQLAELRTGRILAGYGASARPSVPEAVQELHDDGAAPAIASYLLAPGYFHDQLSKAGASVVTDPLLPEVMLAQIALDRYDEACAQLGV